MRKSVLVVLSLCVMAGLAFSARAQEGGGEAGDKPEEKKPAKPAPPPMEEFTLTGKLTAVEKKMKDKTVKAFVLEAEDGTKTTLPPSQAGKKDAPPPVNLEEFIDKKVTVVGMGMKRKMKTKDGEKEMVMLKVIKSVTAAEGGGGGGEK